MKRYVLAALLCTSYVALLVFVFSSDFGEKNSFLFEEKTQPTTTVHPDTGSLFSTPTSKENLHLNLSDEGHSPESAE